MELGVYKGENMADVVVQRWTQLRDENSNHIKRYNDTRAYVFAPDTTHTEVDKLSWRNKTVTPKLTQIYDNLSAQYIQALHPNDAWVTFEGMHKEDQIKEGLVELYLRHKLSESGFIETERKLLSDWILAGYACSGVTHVNEVTKSMVDPNREIPIYRGPKSIRISPYDYVLEPRADSFDESVFIRRRLVPRASILNHDNETQALQYIPEALKNVGDVGSYIRTTEDNLKDSDLKIDGFTSPQEYFTSGMVEILEFWGDVYDVDKNEYRTNWTFGIADRMFVLWDQENFMWNGKKPYAFSSWRERPDNLYGQSPLELLVGMQYRIDHLENAKADVLDVSIQPIINVFGDENDEYDRDVGSINYLGNESRVEYNAPDSSILQVNNEIYTYMQLMEEVAGAPKQSAGHRTKGEKTKFEVSLLDDNASKMFLEKTNHWENTILKRHLNNFYTLLAMNFNIEDVYRVLDDTTGTMDIVSVSKDDVIRDGNLKLRGSQIYEEKNRMLLELRDGASVLYGNPRTEAHIDSLSFCRMVEKGLDWEKHGIIKAYAGLTEQVDGQIAMQMHQEQRQKEQQEMGNDIELQPPGGTEDVKQNTPQ